MPFHVYLVLRCGMLTPHWCWRAVQRASEANDRAQNAKAIEVWRRHAHDDGRRAVGSAQFHED